MTARKRLFLIPVLAAIAPAGLDSASEGLVRWTDTINVATGGGHQGPWAMNDSDYDYVDDPAVAYTPSGKVVVVWADQQEQDLFLQVYTADGEAMLAQPLNVSNSPDTFSWLPRIQVREQDDDLEVFMLWQEIIFSGGSHGGEILFSRWMMGNDSPHPPRNISLSKVGAGKGRISEDYWHNGSLALEVRSGRRIDAAWTDYEGGLWFSRSGDGGDRFSEPLRIGGNEDAPARGPSLAADDNGALHLAWTIGEDFAADIRYATSNDGGETWTTPVTAVETAGYADAPALEVLRNGEIVLAFSEQPEGPFGPAHVRVSSKNSGGTEFSSSRRINDRPSEVFARSGFPEIGSDDEGRLVLLWALATESEGRARALALSMATDDDLSFTAPSLVPEDTLGRAAIHGSLQGMFMQKLALGPNGRVAIANSTFEPGVGSRVQLHLGRLPEP